ncbi:hypothetical protein SynBIOSE41_02481 [Synechococcus sp. BIOS-E4-1]|nr:hypothetical protein SynBIOSE41_02481 [Synechococcus sp. BIOS-E4-1]
MKPPGLLQGHSPSGEPNYTALVEKLKGSSESLVIRIDAGSQTAKTPLVAGCDWCEFVLSGVCANDDFRRK